jgi:sugar phosphate isomerase/epimerase
VAFRFAYSTNAYMNYSVEEALHRIHRLGYQGVELLADVPHAWPVGLLPETIRLIRRTLEVAGLQIANINGFMMRAVGDPRHPYWHPSWIEPAAELRALRREHTRRVLQLAHELGARNVQTEPGGPLPSGMSRRQALQIFYDELMPCVELAEKLEVHLLIEPEPGLLVERFDQYLELADRVGSPFLGLNLDIGHAFCVEEDLVRWIPELASHTRHYHIEDIPADRTHKHLVPGEGAIDLRSVLEAIHRTGYQGWITVELYPYIDRPDEAGRKALLFLQQLVSSLDTCD